MTYTQEKRAHRQSVQTLKLGVFNCRGLDKYKMDYLLQHIVNRHLDIIVVLEHWFQKDYTFIQNHPWTIARSTEDTPQHRQTGRSHGGLLALARPDLHDILHCFHTTKYTLGISINNTYNLYFPYLPPSLPILTWTEELSALPRSPLAIIGDFNVRLGASTGDTTTGPADRRNALGRVSDQWNLSLITPQQRTNLPRTDHLLWDSSKLKNPHWTYEDLQGIVSDHRCMKIHLTLPISPKAKAEPTKRFYLKYLSTEQHRHFLTQAWDDGPGHLLTDMIPRLRDMAPTMDRDLLQNHLDFVNEAIVTGITEVANQTLGTYVVQDMQGTPDHLYRSLQASVSHIDAIRIFKRAQRRRGNNTLSSSNPKLTPIEEAYRHWEASFAGPEHQIPPPPPPPLPAGTRPEWVTQNEHSEFAACKISTLKEIIRKYPADKAPGPDGVHIKLVKVLSTSKSFLTILNGLFQLCAGYGLTPTHWNEATTTLLPKTEQKVADQTRPISLTAIFRRLFEALILRSWLNDPHAKWCQLHPNQAGFRRGFSTLSHILLRDEFSRTTQGCIQAFYDFRDAYNRVNLQKFFDLLHERHCPPRTMSLIYSLMVRSVRNFLVVNGGKSPPIIRTRGFFQGSVLSCLLFNVFIDPLIPLMNNAGVQLQNHEHPHCLAFADDINAGAATVEQAQAQANAIQTWSNLQGMELNLKKCGILGLPPGNQIHIDAGPLPSPPSYKYLGIEVKAKGIDWDGYTKRTLEKTSKLLDFLCQTGADWSAFTRAAIYKTFVRPLTDYGYAPIHHLAKQGNHIGTQTLSSLHSIHTKAHHWIFSSLDRAPSSLTLLESITAMAPPTRRLDELAARFSIHLQRTNLANPIRRAIEHTKSKGYFWKLLHMCSQRHPIIAKFETQMANTPASERVVFSTWLKHDRIDWITIRAATNRHGNKLAKLILNSSRRGNSLFDASLSIPDKTLQDKALRWRQNRIWNPAKHRCKCGHAMSRTHILTCQDLPVPFALPEPPQAHNKLGRPPLPPNLLTISMAKDVQELQARFTATIDNYTCLDYFLNHGRYTSFAHWLSVYQDNTAS